MRRTWPYVDKRKGNSLDIVWRRRSVPASQTVSDGTVTGQSLSHLIHQHSGPRVSLTDQIDRNMFVWSPQSPLSRDKLSGINLTEIRKD